MQVKPAAWGESVRQAKACADWWVRTPRHPASHWESWAPCPFLPCKSGCRCPLGLPRWPSWPPAPPPACMRARGSPSRFSGRTAGSRPAAPLPSAPWDAPRMMPCLICNAKDSNTILHCAVLADKTWSGVQLRGRATCRTTHPANLLDAGTTWPQKNLFTGKGVPAGRARAAHARSASCWISSMELMHCARAPPGSLGKPGRPRAAPPGRGRLRIARYVSSGEEDHVALGPPALHALMRGAAWGWGVWGGVAAPAWSREGTAPGVCSQRGAGSTTAKSPRWFFPMPWDLLPVHQPPPSLIITPPQPPLYISLRPQPNACPCARAVANPHLAWSIESAESSTILI